MNEAVVQAHCVEHCLQLILVYFGWIELQSENTAEANVNGLWDMLTT